MTQIRKSKISLQHEDKISLQNNGTIYHKTTEQFTTKKKTKRNLTEWSQNLHC